MDTMLSELGIWTVLVYVIPGGALLIGVAVLCPSNALSNLWRDRHDLLAGAATAVITFLVGYGLHDLAPGNLSWVENVVCSEAEDEFIEAVTKPPVRKGEPIVVRMTKGGGYRVCYGVRTDDGDPGPIGSKPEGNAISRLVLGSLSVCAAARGTLVSRLHGVTPVACKRKTDLAGELRAVTMAYLRRFSPATAANLRFLRAQAEMVSSLAIVCILLAPLVTLGPPPDDSSIRSASSASPVDPQAQPPTSPSRPSRGKRVPPKDLKAPPAEPTSSRAWAAVRSQLRFTPSFGPRLRTMVLMLLCAVALVKLSMDDRDCFWKELRLQAIMSVVTPGGDTTSPSGRK